MSPKTAKKGKVYQSAKTRQRQGMAGIVRVRKRACTSQRVNDLPLAIDGPAKLILFADDTSLLVTDKNLEILNTKLSANLQIVYNWFKSNLLSINFLKTHCMQFTTKKYCIN
jgi:hypothetical protein